MEMDKKFAHEIVDRLRWLSVELELGERANWSEIHRVGVSLVHETRPLAEDQLVKRLGSLCLKCGSALKTSVTL